MLVLNMPCGAVQVIDPKKLLWMRNALPGERADAVMLLVAGDRLYSVETLPQLQAKFEAAGIPIAIFSPPVGKLAIAVNAGAVAQVERSNPLIYHERARSVLQFSPRLKLAVREEPDEARSRLKAARTPNPSKPIAAARAVRARAASA